MAKNIKNNRQIPHKAPYNIGNEIAANAITNALASGISDMVKQGNEKLDDLEDGKISVKEFTVEVIGKGAGSAAKSGAKTVAALGLKEGAKAVGKKFGKDLAKQLGNNTFTAIAFGVVEQGTDTYLWFRGQITNRDYKVHTSQNVGSVGGAAAGAVLGSTLLPGPGTAFGALFGSMMGSYWGGSLGRSIGEDFFDEEPSRDPHEPIDIEIN